MKKFSIFLLTIIFILSIQTMVLGMRGGGGRQIIAVEQRTMNHFKPNKALSDYLDAQGFKVGISRSEAISYYKFDKTGTDKYWRGDLVDIVGIVGNPIKVGFYEGNFHNDQGQLTNSLYEIRKCIFFEIENFNIRAIVETFGEKYAIDCQSELCLNHHGRYIVFNFQVIEVYKARAGKEFVGSAVVISLQDNTERLIEQAKSKKLVDDTTERIKKEVEVITKPSGRPVIYWRD